MNMKDPYLLHIFNPTKNVSPFDVNMAYEAEFDHVIPYSNVALEEVHGLTQDTIFSRGPSGVKRTGIFIGGREFGLAIDMLQRARAAMVPPFEVSVFVDPSGAITTAAALVACIENVLGGREGLSGKRLHVFGGTGPVGICAGILAQGCGAEVHIVSHRGLRVADEVAREYNARYGTAMRGASGQSEQEVNEMVATTQVIIGAAKAGIRIVSQAQLNNAESLLVAADVNAVPPAGIEGIDVHDTARALEFTPRKALAFGALAIGDVKYKVHHRMFEMIKESSKPLFLDHRESFKVAQALVGASVAR
jgi:methylene-tetrahydromethanopterin dehydrogenase